MKIDNCPGNLQRQFDCGIPPLKLSNLIIAIVAHEPASIPSVIKSRPLTRYTILLEEKSAFSSNSCNSQRINYSSEKRLTFGIARTISMGQIWHPRDVAELCAVNLLTPRRDELVVRLIMRTSVKRRQAQQSPRQTLPTKNDEYSCKIWN